MVFIPSDRISTSQALDMISSISGKANKVEEAKDGIGGGCGRWVE